MRYRQSCASITVPSSRLENRRFHANLQKTGFENGVKHVLLSVYRTLYARVIIVIHIVPVVIIPMYPLSPIKYSPNSG
jgi:hypothetical protein